MLWFGLLLYVSGSNYGHVGTVRSPYQTFFLGKLDIWHSVDFLFIVTPVVGVCNCSMFCYTLRYVHSSIAIIFDVEERAGCFA